VRIVYEDGKEKSVEVKQVIEVLPFQRGQAVSYTTPASLRCRHGGSGRAAVCAWSDAMGVVIDARGRPVQFRTIPSAA
jgi:hypothetical protein